MTYKIKNEENRKIVKLYENKKDILSENSDQLDEKIEDIDKRISKALREQQNESLKKDMEKLKEIKHNKGNMAATFMLKNEIVGNKKSATDPIAIINPITNKQVTNVKEIKSVSLKYCVDLLTNREPKDNYKTIMNMKNELHEIRMKKSHHGDDIKFIQSIL